LTSRSGSVRTITASWQEDALQAVRPIVSEDSAVFVSARAEKENHSRIDRERWFRMAA
jgi:hypothetical protein